MLSLKRLLSRAHNLYWELRMGISTNGIVETNYPDAHHYSTLPYTTIYRILDYLDLGADDVLVDVGSGKGRVLCCAAQYGIREVIGVEIVPELCRIAEKNSRRMRGKKSPIIIYNISAQTFDYSQGTVLTFFNPFGARTFSSVMDKIEEGLHRMPHRIRLAYANPEHEDVLQRRPWLEKVGVWPKETMNVEHSVVFYRSRNNL